MNIKSMIVETNCKGVKRLSITNNGKNICILISQLNNGVKHVEIFGVKTIADVSINNRTVYHAHLDGHVGRGMTKDKLLIRKRTNEIISTIDDNTELNIERLYSSHYRIADFNNAIIISATEFCGLTKISVDGECDVTIHEVKKHTSTLTHMYNTYPKEFYDVIRKYNEYIYTNEDKIIGIDLRIDKANVGTIYLDKDAYSNNKDICIRYETICDCFKEMNRERDMCIEYEIAKNDESAIFDSYKITKESIERLGYSLIYSHDQSFPLWGWSDVIVNLDDFNEHNFLEISQIMSSHKNLVADIDNKYFQYN